MGCSQHGAVLDVLVQSRHNANAARKFFRRLLKGLCYMPRLLIMTNSPATGPHAAQFSARSSTASRSI